MIVWLLVTVFLVFLASRPSFYRTWFWVLVVWLVISAALAWQGHPPLMKD